MSPSPLKFTSSIFSQDIVAKLCQYPHIWPYPLREGKNIYDCSLFPGITLKMSQFQKSKDAGKMVIFIIVAREMEMMMVILLLVHLAAIWMVASDKDVQNLFSEWR